MTIRLDFDGTLTDYHGWRGAGATDAPLPGALEFCQACIARGDKIVVYSARRSTGEITKWLRANGFPSGIEVWKYPAPISDVSIDDRGVAFDGSWDGMADEISGFEPWWKSRGQGESEDPESSQPQEEAMPGGLLGYMSDAEEKMRMNLTKYRHRKNFLSMPRQLDPCSGSPG